MAKARAKLASASPPVTEAEWHPRLGPLPTHAAQPEAEEDAGPADPSLRAFLALEKTLTQKSRANA